MCDWFDVRSTRDEFDSLVAAQAASLDADQETILETYRVVPWQAIMRRSEQMRYEAVWVLAEREGQVLYFDDVEWGWNLSEVDDSGRILRPGGGQCELQVVL